MDNTGCPLKYKIALYELCEKNVNLILKLGRIEVKSVTKNVVNKSKILYNMEHEWIVDRGDLLR